MVPPTEDARTEGAKRGERKRGKTSEETSTPLTLDEPVLNESDGEDTTRARREPSAERSVRLPDST